MPATPSSSARIRQGEDDAAAPAAICVGAKADSPPSIIAILDAKHGTHGVATKAIGTARLTRISLTSMCEKEITARRRQATTIVFSAAAVKLKTTAQETSPPVLEGLAKLARPEDTFVSLSTIR